jgi:hypothetical protein
MKVRWTGHVALTGGKRNPNRLLVKKRPLGRSRRGWVDEMDLPEIEWGDRVWIDVTQDWDQCAHDKMLGCY